MLSCYPILRLAANKSFRSASVSRVFGFTRTPIVVALGTSWRSNSNRFAPKSLTIKTTPVILSPGRAKAGNKAVPDRVTPRDEDDWHCYGCSLGHDSRGIVRDDYGHRLLIKSATNSPQCNPTTSARPNRSRNVLTLDKPLLLKPWRNVVTNRVESAGDVLRRNPTTGTFGR